MHRLSRTFLVLAPIAAVGLTAEGARAQTTAPTSTTTTTIAPAVPCVASAGGQATVSVSQQLVPTRFVNGQNLGTSTRQPSQNPNGISFSDCAEDMTLQFPVTACNFNGQSLQVWASVTSNCEAATDRGHGMSSLCWPVSQGSTGLVISQGLETYDIRVQDIVGPQNESPSPTTLQTFGSSACFAQSTFLAVPININFIPVDTAGNLAGQAYHYTLSTDLVGPPPPSNVTIADGDTLFVVNWTPRVDTDTGGYDVLIDPIPGQEPLDGAAAVATDAATGAISERICPAEAGASMEDGATDGEVGDGQATDATVVDATTMAPASPPFPADAAFLDDAGCYTRQVTTNPSTGSASTCTVCSDSLLSGGVVTDGGSSTPVEEFDDAGNVIDSGVQSTTGGGIFQPPPGHVLSPNATTGTTATGETNSTFTVTGLKNGVPYTVVVSSVDNFGNVGPPSTQACDCPAPVNDFWKIYRTDGGNAGGGFCALEAVGAPAETTVAFAGAGALVIAGLRRRRSKRR